ncbi:hypothetical protein [Halosimplex carlsbadense]|uniref:hypothetical protein n=1 Tax=Halosimplex carlsbadense TaxID=171164 RepID=UPI001955379E|nr:hypothetical protein [Halosimplex carlsbadense]
MALRRRRSASSHVGAHRPHARRRLRLSGLLAGVPTGAVETLVQRATEKGSVTPEEIAEILGQPELPVEYSHEFSVSEE